MRRALGLAVTALLALACPRSGPVSGGFEDIYPRARSVATTTVQGEVGGWPVVVHAGPPFDENDARRFLLGLETYRKEVVEDYALLRSGVERHLGPDLMTRMDRTSVLKVPAFPSTWYLLGGDWPGAMQWTGPKGSTYHIVRKLDDPFLPRSFLRHQVHTKTHFIIRSLGVDRPAVWPRWLEEGLAEWNRLQFGRLKDGTWDGDAEVLARLTWQRASVRQRLMHWRNPKGTGYLDARFEPEWESDLLYKGALGAVLALDQELPGGAIGLVKEMARVLPETDDDALQAVERHLERPLASVGRLTADARVSLRETLLSRARAGELPAVTAMGQFPEAASAMAEVLTDFARRGEPETVIAAVTGIRYLGDRRLLDRTLKEIERGAGPDLRATLAGDNRWAMAAAFARSGKEGDWYAAGAPAVYMGTGPGTGRPSSRPSTSPTR